MRILVAAGSPIAGTHMELAHAINAWTDHEARVLCDGLGWHKCYRRWWPETPVLDVHDPEDVLEQTDWADVIHCSASVSARTLGRLDLLGKKTWVFQWHGLQVHPWEEIFRPEDERHYGFLHIGQGWIGAGGQADFFARFRITILPQLIPIWDEPMLPNPEGRIPGLIVYHPSTLRRGCNYKGSAEVRHALAGLALDFRTSIPFEESLAARRRAALGIDDPWTPYVHKTAIEFASLGVPCVERVGEAARREMEVATGATSLPFVEADVTNLREVVDGLLRDELALAQIGRAARQWVEEHYDPRFTAASYVTYYEAIA